MFKLSNLSPITPLLFAAEGADCTVQLRIGVPALNIGPMKFNPLLLNVLLNIDVVSTGCINNASKTIIGDKRCN